jgi:WD40 repeat protein
VAGGRELGRVELGGDDIGWDVALFGDDRLATQSDRGIVTLWDATTLARLPAPDVVTSRLRELVVDGDRLYVATPDQLVALDVQGKVVARTSRTLAFDVDVLAGTGPLALGDSRGEVALYDRATLAPIRAWETEEELVVASVRFRPDGGVLASATQRTVQVWDPRTGRELARKELPFMIFQLTWSPDGRRLAIAGGGGTVWLWDLSTGAGADLDGFTACVSPWRLEDSALVAAPFDPAACAVLGAPVR